MDSACARQRSSVVTEMLNSRATASIGALSGGNNLATALSLNACPYLATSFFHNRPLIQDSIEATTILTQGDLEAARTWGHEFVRWYNAEHRHSGIRYVTPAQRHAGEDNAILAARHQTYLQARQGNPARWSGNTRDWSPIGAVTLNPERDAVIRDLQAENKTRFAA